MKRTPNKFMRRQKLSQQLLRISSTLTSHTMGAIRTNKHDFYNMCEPRIGDADYKQLANFKVLHDNKLNGNYCFYNPCVYSRILFYRCKKFGCLNCHFPICAAHVKKEHYIYDFTSKQKSKLLGTSVDIYSLGRAHVPLKRDSVVMT